MASFPTRKTVLGLPFAAGRETLLPYLEEQMAKGRYTAIFTPNAQIAAEAAASLQARRLLSHATVLVADGVGITLAAKLSGKEAPERIPGIELGEDLVAAAARQGIPVFFYGGKPEVASLAAERMRKRYPDLVVAGALCGFGEEEVAARQMQKSGAGLYLVCLGFPRQEEFILRHPMPGVMLGLGGTLDVFSGRVKRAPVALRYLRCEWLWRVLLEPRRIFRLRRVPGYLLFAWRQGRKARAGRKKYAKP